MTKYVIALVSALVAAWALVGFAAPANAHGYYPGCNCGPVAPTTHYKIVHVAKFYTHYHDESVYKHVQRVHRVTTVTQIQPIIHIHDVTRIHHSHDRLDGQRLPPCHGASDADPLCGAKRQELLRLPLRLLKPDLYDLRPRVSRPHASLYCRKALRRLVVRNDETATSSSLACSLSGDGARQALGQAGARPRIGSSAVCASVEQNSRM